MIECSWCGAEISTPMTMIIDADGLRKGTWQLRCDCDHLFSIEEFQKAGAVLRTGSSALRAMRATN